MDMVTLIWYFAKVSRAGLQGPQLKLGVSIRFLARPGQQRPVPRVIASGEPLTRLRISLCEPRKKPRPAPVRRHASMMEMRPDEKTLAMT